MLFFFKKKKIVVDCFTYSDAAYQLYKIRKATVFYPEEWKKMSAWVENPPIDRGTGIKIPMPTIKQCTGINKLYKQGAIIPLWLDFIMQPKTAAEGKTKLGMTEPMFAERIIPHPRSQYPGFLENYIHVKISSVWNLVEKSGVNFVWLPALYNLNALAEHIIIPPAITYYDWQAQTNLNMFVHKNAPDMTLKAGTPMVQIVPMTDKEVEYKCHLVGFEEYTSKNTIPQHFPSVMGVRNNRFMKDKATAERLDKLEQQESKCPFGFGKK
jgi:hypothetical protein